MFRSDSQRRAMFANMSGRNSFSKDNKFALYVKKNLQTGGLDLRSDKYPTVDVDITNFPTKKYKVLNSDDQDKELFLSDVSYIKSGPARSSSHGMYDVDTSGITLDIPQLNAYQDRRGNKENEGIKNILRHELLHHIDDELTMDNIRKSNEEDAVFEDFAKFKDIWEGNLKEYNDEIADGKVLDDEDLAEYNFLLDIQDRYKFATSLKKKTTPTFKELEEYAE